MSEADCCILFEFYIKPQLRELFDLHHAVVYYLNSTSNHNIVVAVIRGSLLYTI